MNKNYYSSYIMLFLNQSELRQFIFFQEIFHENSQTKHLNCFSQYIRTIYVKYFHCFKTGKVHHQPAPCIGKHV